MTDILTQMELCPHCKKQFKRLKSHLLYCKKIEVNLPLDSDITDSKAALFQAPKSKELQKKLIQSDEETHKINQRRNTNPIKARFSANAEMRTNVQTSEDMKKQIKIIPQMTQNHLRPKRVVFSAKNGHLLFAAKKYSKAKFAAYSPKTGETKSKNPSENLGSSPSKHSTDEDNKCYSGLLNVNRIEHSGQKLLTETLDLPFIISENFPSLDGCQNPFATLQSNERSPKIRDPISEASQNNFETQRRNTGSCFSANYVNSLYKKLHTGGMENHPVKLRAKKKDFGLEAAGKSSWNKGSEGNKLPEVKVPKLDYMKDDLRKQFDKNDLATEKTTHHDNLASALLPSGRLACKETLSLADLGNQRLSTLVLKYIQEEEDGYKALVIPTNPMESKKPLSSELDPDPKTWATLTKCQQPLNLACHCTPKNLANGHIEALGSKSLPMFLGLELFPELYPGYLHLGIFPGRFQKGNIEVQKHHSFTEVERALQVPVWERSLMNIKIGKLPSWHIISNFSLMGLLGKVQKAWIRYPNYVNLKKGSVGGITMLFAGYWVLCCTWSFKHLKLQRWRKLH